MPPINVLMKPMSGSCNMSCDYCFYCDESKKRSCESFGRMTEDTLKNVIRRTMAQAEGRICFAYQGGEPTLRGLDFYKKVIQLQRQYNKKGIQVFNALQTNGYYLNEEWCRFFHENHFLIGVSLDGTEEIHNMHRRDKQGKPTYQKILNSIRLLEYYKVEFNILTVVTKDIAEQANSVYEAYKKNGWFFQQYIACLDPLGEKRGEKPYSLTPEIYGIFLTKLFELWAEDWIRDRRPYIRQFENYIGILKGFQPESCEQRGYCGLQVVVEADGSVYPCDFYILDEYCLGNLNNQRLDKIDNKRKQIKFIERSLELPMQCKTCKYQRLCKGGCYRNREYLQNSGEYMNYFCKSYQILFDNCYAQMKKIADM